MIPSLIKSALLVAGISGVAVASGIAQEQLGWQRATQALQAGQPSGQSLAPAITQWRQLSQGSGFGFESYARFLLQHPGWPNETQLRRSAEQSLAAPGWSPQTVTVFFRQFPPQSGMAKVRFAQALAAIGSTGEAADAARAAWRGGALSSADEATVLASFGSALTVADHDARMDALLWQNQLPAAAREIGYVSPQARPVLAARLAFRTNAPDAATLAAGIVAGGGSDAGYIADRAVWLNAAAGVNAARSYLATRPAITGWPGNVEKWYELLLTQARNASNDNQFANVVGIAARVDDAYPAGTDVSAQSYGERDDYTSLVWLAGQTALKRTGNPAQAIGLFERYSNGSRAPGVRSKGLYWAGRAAEAAGQRDAAMRYFERAAQYHDLFYGQLATERLGRPLLAPAAPAPRTVDPAQRQGFYNREVVRAAQYLGTIGDWEDQTAFVRQIALDAHSDADHALATELSRSLGRPDLGVMIGRSALQNGLTDYSTVAFPTVRVPDSQAGNWVMIHAIARQESQFDRAAVSRAGARGLMQLMPGTARDTANRMGLTLADSQLTTDTDINVSLGATYFQHLYELYGSYPLAVAAYNAGPGNVNRWLRANGDPRTGGVEWVDWIEAIPIYETRNYVQRVLENAVVYDLLNPQRARSTGANRLSWYLGKSRPG